MSAHSNHPFHLVDYSPWPLWESIGAMTMLSGMVKWFNKLDSNLLILGNVITLLTVYQWCITSKNMLSNSYLCSNISPTMSNNFIYYVWSTFFYFFLLGIFP